MPELSSSSEILNKIATHLLIQNEQSSKEISYLIEQCVLRSPRGLKCAIGCLIPDEDYLPEMEEGELYSDTSTYLLKWIERNGLLSHLELLKDLQFLHDQNDPQTWKTKLIELSYKYSICLDVKTFALLYPPVFEQS